MSAVSVCEIALKRRTGKLAFVSSPSGAIGKNGFFELAILPMDAETAGDFDWNHNDPFDRLLVAQAIRMKATLVTADAVIRAFDQVVRYGPDDWSG